MSANVPGPRRPGDVVDWRAVLAELAPDVDPSRVVEGSLHIERVDESGKAVMRWQGVALVDVQAAVDAIERHRL